MESRKLMSRVLVSVFAVGLLVISGVAWGQSTTSLRGTVADPSGSVVPKATVTLTNVELKTERTTTSGTQGDYQFLLLPPGTYTLTVTAPGFALYEQTSLQLLVNTPATANVRLKIGTAKETVTVNTEAPLVNQTDASIGNPFEERQIKQIPLEGRNVPDLLSLQAGVVYTDNRPRQDPNIDRDQDTRAGSVNGARSDQSNITLDGVDVNDQNGGYAFTSVLPTTLDSVEEFRVTTSNYNADQGVGSGAQVALVTKSGTNNFHGSLYEYNRNTITSANDQLAKAAERRNNLDTSPLKLIRNIFGASVGGPIQKDRLFFFANYEGTRQREQQSTVRVIPTPTLCQGIIQYENVPVSQGGPGGITTIMPADLKTLDPTNAGINPAMLNGSTGYLDTTFCNGNRYPTNDPSVGDGLNYSGFRFRAPVSSDNNVFIARIDYHLTANGKHTLFWRGNLQNRTDIDAPFLPGTAPEQTVVDHSKGFAVGYTAILSSNKVNSFRWGFTRQSTGFIGNSDNQAWNVFYGLDQGITYSRNLQTPTHNLVDDFSWTKGKHALTFGANLGYVRNPRVSFQHSWNVGKGATNWMSPTGFANTGSYLDPANNGFPEPASSPQYDYPVLALLGMTSDIIANYNYDKSGNLQAQGAPVNRNYGLDWWEFYGQDSWRIKQNLTVTAGVRWSLYSPPWEVNGFQASPTCIAAMNPGLGCPAGTTGDLGAEFAYNVANMQKGIGYGATPLVSYVLGGPANGGPGYWQFEKSDFSPRIAVAYSPRPETQWLRKLVGEGDKTVIRAGFSRVYDRPGMQVLSTFDANPPGGLGATLQNFCCLPGYDDAANAPRITNINQIQPNGVTNQVFLQAAPPGAFPQTPNPFAQAITWGVDQSIKTPYAWAVDFSIARELPKKMSLQVAYVGRFGRNLMTQRDLRQPLDLVDPKTGIDYYAAATALSQLAAQHPFSSFPGATTAAKEAAFQAFVGSITDAQIGPTAAYWHDMLPPLQAGAANYTSFSGFTSPNLIPTIYDLYFDPLAASYPGNEVVGLGNVDLYCGLGDNLGNVYNFSTVTAGCTGVGSGQMLNNQDTTMFAWSSIGRSDYHALQVTFRKQFGSGLQFDVNYTFSKSIDYTSSATRLGFSSSINVGAPGTRLVNAFNPYQRRAVSDFDTPHQINIDWIAELPFGKGRHFAANAGSSLNAFIGGWQLSGVSRWTSGFPFTVDNGNFWPTNWDEQGIAQMVATPQTGHFVQPDGTVSAFPNPAQAFQDFVHPFPGQGGTRNAIRGDGYAGLDMALSKRWMLPKEGSAIQFRWEVFNVPNLVRYNALSGLGTQACACIASLQQDPSKFGNYTGLLTQPRVMQFALRFEF